MVFGTSRSGVRRGRGGLVAALAALWFASVVAAQPTPRPPKAPKAPKDRTLCVVSDSGIVRCVRPELLEGQLPPGLVQRLEELAERIWSEHGLADSANTAFRCGGEWKTKNLNAGISTSLTDPASRKQARTLPSASDRSSMVSDCRAALRASVSAGGWGGVGGGRGSRDSWVAGSVAKMDKAVGACQDDRNRSSMVSWTPIPKDLLEDWEKTKGNVRSDFDREGLQTTVDIITKELARNSAEKFQLSMDPVANKEKLAKNREVRDLLMEILNDVIAQAKNWPAGFLAPGQGQVTPGQPVPTQVPPNPTPLGPAPTPARNPTPIPSGPATPCEGEGCKPSCEQIQAMWDAFKEFCEQSDWQVYRCEAFLRTLNGCVDPALINPGPDGDLTCPERAKYTEAEKGKIAFLAACKKRRMIATPVDNGGLVCLAPELDAIPPGIDICSDPRVMPGPDQCTGPNVPAGDEPPRPKPNPRG